MVSNAYISPYAEIFNTYGEDLSNAQLLARYGFALAEGNDGDVVSWEVGEAVEGIKARFGEHHARCMFALVESNKIQVTDTVLRVPFR